MGMKDFDGMPTGAWLSLLRRWCDSAPTAPCFRSAAGILATPALTLLRAASGD